jgi:glutamate racemase
MSATLFIPAPRVLVFDSGVGGLSVAAEIQLLLPHVSIIYASDNAAFPYGTKKEDELLARVEAVVEQLLNRFQADILVIACNTASTLTLPQLRQRFNIPIVGVVPAIKPAAERSKTGVIGLLATPATVARAYTHELIKLHASHCQVICLGSSELVLLAEQKLRGEAVAPQCLSKITKSLLASANAEKMDKLVLACTHFPLLRTELQTLLPSSIELIDSGTAIAQRVRYLLNENPQEASAQRPAPEHIAIFTAQTPQTDLLRNALKSFGIYLQSYL